MQLRVEDPTATETEDADLANPEWPEKAQSSANIAKQNVLTSGFVCHSCNFIDDEGEDASICGLVALNCIRSLFTLDTEAARLPTAIQHEEIRRSLVEVGYFEALAKETDILPRLCWQSISDLLEIPLFSKSLVSSSHRDIVEGLSVEAQILSAFRKNPFLLNEEAAGLIFTARRSDRQSTARDSYHAASFRFQSPLIHRFALIDCVPSTDSLPALVQIHFLDSAAAVCSHIVDTFRRRNLVASAVYTLTSSVTSNQLDEVAVKSTAHPLTLSHVGAGIAESSPNPPGASPNDGEVPCLPHHPTSSLQQLQRSVSEEDNGVEMVSAKLNQPLYEANATSSTSTRSGPQSFATRGDDVCDLATSGTGLDEANTINEPVVASSSCRPPSELIPEHSDPCQLPEAVGGEVTQSFNMHSHSVPFEDSKAASGSLSHRLRLGEDDEHSLNLESPPPYELLSPHPHLLADTDIQPVGNDFAGSAGNEQESSAPAAQCRDDVIRSPSPSHENVPAGISARARSKQPMRKPIGGEFSWMMSLQDTSIIHREPPVTTKKCVSTLQEDTKEALIPPAPQPRKFKPIPPPGSTPKVPAPTGAPIFYNSGQLDLLFSSHKTLRSKRSNLEQKPEYSGNEKARATLDHDTHSPPSSLVGAPSFEDPSDFNRKSLSDGQAAVSNTVSAKAKLKRRESHLSNLDDDWQLGLQRSQTTAKKKGHSDAWSPLLLRPELLEASDRAEGSSTVKPTNQQKHIRPSSRQTTQSYKASRNDIAWQLALVSKVLAPSEDYLKEREERFIQLNPRYKPERFECLICFETILGADGARVMNCEHSFCRDCLTGHVRSQLDENQYPILCPVCFPDPDRTTRGFIDDIVLEDLDLSVREIEKFSELQMNAVIVKIDCPGCKGDLIVAREEYLSEPFISCNLEGCSSRFCRACLMVMEGADDRHTCKIDEELDALMKANGWRYCPGCRTPIQKDSGCNHMTCKTPGCTTHFCYVCGNSIWNAQSPQSLSTLLSEHYRGCNQFDVDPPAVPARAGALDANGRPRRDCTIQ